ncbi:hypothetical protein JVU11DRAFT_9357 [Chiua virens]|nr:hypothetical protein JVU11DRAFT_9357 [Chiua virens]
MGAKTYEMLTLLSRAVARIPPDTSNKTVAESAKTLLQKCLSQFSRQQQIHAQQAARYLSGHDDSISSHKTVALMSSIAIAYVKDKYLSPETNDASSESVFQNGEDIEQPRLRISTNREGELVETNQLHHYLYRSDALSHMSFYEFGRCVELQPKSQSRRIKHTHETRLSHPLHATHELLEHTNESRGDVARELVPRIVGTSIPRSTHKRVWALFMLAHFKPFSCDTPLFAENDIPEEMLEAFKFSDASLIVMKNWEAVHECEDERDADRLRKQTQRTAASSVRDKNTQKGPLMPNGPGDEGDEIQDILNQCSRAGREEFAINQAILLYREAKWLSSESNLAQNADNLTPA